MAGRFMVPGQQGEIHETFRKWPRKRSLYYFYSRIEKKRLALVAIRILHAEFKNQKQHKEVKRLDGEAVVKLYCNQADINV